MCYGLVRPRICARFLPASVSYTFIQETTVALFIVLLWVLMTGFGRPHVHILTKRACGTDRRQEFRLLQLVAVVRAILDIAIQDLARLTARFCSV